MTSAGEEERIVTLDLLRGVAVMGIFSVNVIAFAMPFGAYLNPAVYGGASGANLWVWAANFVLVDGKMRGLFTLLFGASTLLVIQRAEAAELAPEIVHFRRMGWLLIFGLLHYYLIWFGDILTLYASVGMILFMFREAPMRLLVAAGLILLAADMAMAWGMSAGMAAAEAAALRPGASPGAAGAFRDVAGFLLPLQPDALARDIALHRGPYSGLLRYQLGEGALGPVYQLMLFWPEALGSMLLGMAALRCGFLTGAWSRSAYIRVALAGLLLGGTGYAWLGWDIRQSDFDPAILYRDFYALSAPCRLAMMFGYAALIILLARKGGALARRIAAVGRTAFTNYLGSSLLAGFLFYGWGLGIYGQFGRAEAWLLAPLFWIAMLVWSKPWLDRFRYGPLEYAWRSLARGRLQPFRR